MSAGTVGLVVALSAEARALTGRAQPVERVVEIAERVYLRVGGMGGRAAALSCAALADAGAEALVSVGCAAGLTPECPPGAVVVPARVHSSRGKAFAVDVQWRTALLAALQSRFCLFVGDIAGVDHIVRSAEKQLLGKTTEMVAADMESAAIASEAARLGLPMIAVRAVADGADDDVPGALPVSIDPFGRPRLASLLEAVIHRPGDAAGLLRLRRGFNKACRTLSRLAANPGLTFCRPEKVVG